MSKNYPFMNLKVPDDFIYKIIELDSDKPPKMGDVCQFTVLSEECSELIKACTKINRRFLNGECIDPEMYENLKEEMAHVLITMAIVMKRCDIETGHLQEWVDKKVEKFCGVTKVGKSIEDMDIMDTVHFALMQIRISMEEE